MEKTICIKKKTEAMCAVIIVSAELPELDAKHPHTTEKDYLTKQ